MSEEDLEVLITLDDPGEDTLEEDTFDHLHPERRGSGANNRQTNQENHNELLFACI